MMTRALSGTLFGSLGCLWAFAATAAPTVTITAPSPGSIQQGVISITANVVPGAAVLARVQASIGALSVDLTYQGGTVYTGDLELSQVPWGPQTLVVTASDTAPSSASARLGFIHDERPAFALDDLPRNAYLPPGPVHYRVRCSDDGPLGCTTFELVVHAGNTDTVVATGTTTIDAMIDFSAFPEQLVRVSEHAIDSAGQEVWFTGARSQYFVTATPALCMYAAPIGYDYNSGFIEPILDADDDRILTGLRVIDRANTTTVAAQPSGIPWTSGLLIPGGAVFGRYDVNMAWNGGGIILLPSAVVPGGSDLRMQGGVFSAFGSYILPFGSPNHQIDVSQPGATVSFNYGTDADSWIGSVDTTTGLRCTVLNNVIDLVDASDTAQRSVVLDPGVSLFECVVDDGNIVYRYTTTTLAGPGDHTALAMIDRNGATTVLIPEEYTSSDGWGVPNQPGRPGDTAFSYGTAGDWIFYWHNGQNWQRSPTGALTAATPVLPPGSATPSVFAMAPNGELILSGSPTGSGANDYGIHRVAGGSIMSAATFVATQPFGVFGTDLLPIWRGGRWVFVEATAVADGPPGDIVAIGGAWLLNDTAAKPYECSLARNDDGGIADGGVARDAGALDAGAADAGALDAGAADAVALDAIAQDVGAPDAGALDAETPDAVALDAGTPDAVALDAIAQDVGAPDAGASVQMDAGLTRDGSAPAPDTGAPGTALDAAAAERDASPAAPPGPLPKQGCSCSADPWHSQTSGATPLLVMLWAVALLRLRPPRSAGRHDA
jgi:hypothetical protein